MAKQTPYRYSADAKEIIRNTHDFCKRKKEDGLKILLNLVERKSINSNRSRQNYDRAGNATRQGDRSETLFDLGVLYSDRRLLPTLKEAT